MASNTLPKPYQYAFSIVIGIIFWVLLVGFIACMEPMIGTVDDHLMFEVQRRWAATLGNFRSLIVLLPSLIITIVLFTKSNIAHYWLFARLWLLLPTAFLAFLAIMCLVRIILPVDEPGSWAMGHARLIYNLAFGGSMILAGVLTFLRKRKAVSPTEVSKEIERGSPQYKLAVGFYLFLVAHLILLLVFLLLSPSFDILGILIWLPLGTLFIGICIFSKLAAKWNEKKLQ